MQIGLYDKKGLENGAPGCRVRSSDTGQKQKGHRIILETPEL